MADLPEPFATHLPPLLALAFAEDLPDITSTALFGPDDRLQALLRAKEEGVLCGMPGFAHAFATLDPTCEVDPLHGEGDWVQASTVVAHVAGRARTVMAAERTALNLLSRLSGIATLTHRYVTALVGTRCRVLDTRKTTAGWRALEKYAVRCGGGTNHRMGLFDAAMIKDRHLAAAGSLSGAVAKVRERWGDGVSLVVECADLEQLREALSCGVRHVMLDNMELEAMRAAVAENAGRATLEASGGITLENARAVAETGVDFISIGALTHSAPALDLSLKVVS